MDSMVAVLKLFYTSHSFTFDVFLSDSLEINENLKLRA